MNSKKSHIISISANTLNPLIKAKKQTINDKFTYRIAMIAILISLIGGIPGGISVWHSIFGKPKLNIIYRNCYISEFKRDNKTQSFVYLILSIGNEGTLSFKRFGNPVIEVNINNKWVKLNSQGTTKDMIENIPSKTRDLIAIMKIPDYYNNNITIQPFDNIDVFLFAYIDSNILKCQEISSSNHFRLTFKDTKSRKHTHIIGM